MRSPTRCANDTSAISSSTKLGVRRSGPQVAASAELFALSGTDTEIRGVPIAKVDKAVLCGAWANRDEPVCGAGDRFDVGWTPK